MMKLRLVWQDVRSSLWFLPSVIVLGAIVLALGLIEAHNSEGTRLLERWPVLSGAGADGARGLLVTIAGSMISLAGVVFSITIVALSLASGQYTSRVLRNFMNNRVNQTVLGVFVGIFAYCLVVLRTIRGGDEGAFVPFLAVLMALILALLGIAMLIHFIHHIVLSIQAANILAEAAEETLRMIDQTLPQANGEEDDDEEDEEEWHTESLPGGNRQPIHATATGYLQHLDTGGIAAFATRLGTHVRMTRRVGEFVIEGVPVAYIAGSAAPAGNDLRYFSSLYAVGRQRTIQQDPAFGIRQLVDAALKALSPGINDTTTALMSVDYLTAILVRIAGRRIVSRYHDPDGTLRLVTRARNYVGLCGQAFDQIRQNAGGNMAVLERLLESLALLATRSPSPARRQGLLEHARAVAESARRTIVSPLDSARIEAVADRVLSGISGHR